MNELEAKTGKKVVTAINAKTALNDKKAIKNINGESARSKLPG